MSFTGLPKDFFDFFVELKENNNRAWFEDNKPRYQESVQEPLLCFVEDMAPRLKKISKHFVADPRKNRGSVFRIYRDVRFSKDKTPYKTHGAIQFRHARGKDAHAPGFYVHLAPDEIRYGGGVWTPAAPALLKIREAIRDTPKAWTKIVEHPDFKNHFDHLRGDSLTRPPKGFSHDDPCLEYLKRKSFFAMAKGKKTATRKTQFLDDVEQAMIKAKPMMKFLTNAVGAPF